MLLSSIFMKHDKLLLKGFSLNFMPNQASFFEKEIFFFRIGGTVTARVLSSRNRTEKKSRRIG
jgi:hypothetical protein